MGFMNIFRNKQSVEENKKLEARDENENTDKVKQEKPFVADISTYELENANWTKFAAQLKSAKILPNSYIKTPTSVEVSLDKQNRPKVTLEFKSATSDSVRTFMLLQDEAFQYVNGAINERNDELLKLWSSFQNQIRYVNKFLAYRQEYIHKNRGEKLLRKANKTLEMGDFYERELAFLEENKDASFGWFAYAPVFERNDDGYTEYACELPTFFPLIARENGLIDIGANMPALPFTPKTLEYCLLNMTNDLKEEEGENLQDFEKKCREIQEYSCFETEDWDKVIKFGMDMVKRAYQVSVLKNER